MSRMSFKYATVVRVDNSQFHAVANDALMVILADGDGAVLGYKMAL